VPVDDEGTQSTYTTPPEQTSPATAVTSTSAYPEDTESFTSSPLAASPSATPSRSAKTAPVATSTSLNPWWWVTIGVGVALALTVAALLTRRKRTAVHAKRGGDA
jgi:hypothetical protein